MRMVLAVFVLLAAACSQPANTFSEELPPLYCLGPAQPRASFLAANYERLIPEVRAHRIFVLNQTDSETVRIAHIAEASTCAGEEPIELGEMGTLNGVRRQANDARECTVHVFRSEGDPYGSLLLQEMLAIGLTGEVIGDGDQFAVTVQDDCALAAPVVGALAARTRG